MDERPEDGAETDPRFPSGPWVGFFVQKYPPLGRQSMELRLTFRNGVLKGEGRDLLGAFLVTGRYEVGDGQCHWTKRYIGRHDVFYKGFNEGKGIWGGWQIPGHGISPDLHGGFHIWPEGLPDPTEQHLTAAAEIEEGIQVGEPVAVPCGQGVV